MQRVSEIEGEPVVGRYYLVPSIRIRGVWIPIFGPKHEDRDYIGFTQHHYHFDLRFLSDAYIKFRVGHYYEKEQKPTCAPEQFMMQVVTVEIYGESAVVERRKLCRRRMPIFPTTTGVTTKNWFPKLEAAYAETKLNCARCPHRGFPLSKDNADEDGNVVCPGHGLCFNLNTGRLVSRLEHGA